MIDYAELMRLAEPFGRDDFDPSALLLRHDVNPEDVTRIALQVVHASTLYTRPEPTDVDAAAVFIQGFQLALVLAEARYVMEHGQ